MRLILAMPGNEAFGGALAQAMPAELGVLETRRFPDEESYVRIQSDVSGRDVGIVCTLARPDAQFLRLLFAADAARDLGASRVTLIAPYLAYMRQDTRFKPGEAVSSATFARVLSSVFDEVITVDPHLHRLRSLGEVFSIPTRLAHAAPLLADWIRANVERPFLIGPDKESEQWVAAVAARAGAPSAVSSKTRLGDRAVEIALPDLEQMRGLQPVLIDDMISSGRTMIEAARQLVTRGAGKPYCLAVHALFADDSYAELSASAARVVSADTVPHVSNAISVAGLIAEALQRP